MKEGFLCILAKYDEPLIEIHTSTGEFLLGIKEILEDTLCIPAQFAFYSVLFVPEGNGILHADFSVFAFQGPCLLFSTPLQVLYMEECSSVKCRMLQFHGDFYCIEYHRKEVSCNGLLFNNIYVDPLVILTPKEAVLFSSLLTELNEEMKEAVPSETTLRAFLQLFLAKSSSIKIKAMNSQHDKPEPDDQMERFRQILDQHYLELHKPSDYSSMLAMSPDNFTKRCTRYFKKTPSQLIQERLILEAKKQLHLTRQSIKQIAYNLKFEDEFYFSRVFKKFTKVSPQAFRDKTGISIVADFLKH